MKKESVIHGDHSKILIDNSYVVLVTSSTIYVFNYDLARISMS